MNRLRETPSTLICALAEWYGKRISRLFCTRRFLQRATLASRLLLIPISQSINTPRSGMWPPSGLTLAQQGEGRTAQGGAALERRRVCPIVTRCGATWAWTWKLAPRWPPSLPASLETACYVLFDGYTDALALYTALRGAGVGARVSPTPRQARSECGSALLVDCDDRTRIESLAAAQGLAFQRIVELERQIDASRDRFC